MVEHHRRALMAMVALHGANAPISAARLLDGCQAHVLEALAWALDAPPPPAVHAYAAIIWHCTPLLLPRLDISQRMALCQARPLPAPVFLLVLAQALWRRPPWCPASCVFLQRHQCHSRTCCCGLHPA